MEWTRFRPMFALLLAIVCCTIFTADTRLALCGAADDAVPKDRGLLLTLNAHDGEVTAVAYSPDGRVLASAGLDGMICLWEMPGGRALHRFLAHPGGVYSLSYSPDGTLLASAGADALVRIWHAKTGREARQLKGHEGKVAAVAFAPDGKIVASGGYDKTIRLWNLQTGKQEHVLLGHKQRVTALAFSPDGSRLASGGTQQSTFTTAGGNRFRTGEADFVCIWDITAARRLLQLSTKGSVLVSCRAGAILAATGLSCEVEPESNGQGSNVYGIDRINLIDWTSGEVVQALNWRGSVVALTDDGKVMATAAGRLRHFEGFGAIYGGGPNTRYDYDNLCLWETITHREILRLPPKPYQVISCNSSKNYLTCAIDGSIEVWGIPRLLSFSAEHSSQPNDLETAWKELGMLDPRRGQLAVGTMLSHGTKAVRLLREKLREVPREKERQLHILARQLEAEDFQLREAAFSELRLLGGQFKPALEREKEKAGTIDTKRMLATLLKELAREPPSSEVVRAARAIQVLEWIATDDAMAVLQKLGLGTEGAVQTQDAKASLARLSQAALVKKNTP